VRTGHVFSQEFNALPVSSMTGFARVEGHADACAWTWEVRSVNGKGLDIRCRLPSGFEALDPPTRARVKKRFTRGNVTLNLSVSWAEARSGWQVNPDLLDQIATLLPAINEHWPGAGEPSADGLLSVRGLIEPVEEELDSEARAELDTALLAGLDTAIDALEVMRAEEGARLADVLGAQVETIEELCRRAEELADAQPAAIKARLKEQVEALMAEVPALPEERLAQEAALLMTKADIREELDRLTAHVAAVRDHLAADGAVGRKLDFLCQEFMRESNTLCAKSADVDLTRTGIDLKAVIEQFREQVQNIE